MPTLWRLPYSKIREEQSLLRDYAREATVLRATSWCAYLSLLVGILTLPSGIFLTAVSVFLFWLRGNYHRHLGRIMGRLNEVRSFSNPTILSPGVLVSFNAIPTRPSSPQLVGRLTWHTPDFSEAEILSEPVGGKITLSRALGSPVVSKGDFLRLRHDDQRNLCVVGLAPRRSGFLKYLTWLDHILQPSTDSNYVPGSLGDYEVRVAESPSQLSEWIGTKNTASGRSRLMATYCWRWRSKEDLNVFDVTFPNDQIGFFWEFDEDGSWWTAPHSSLRYVGSPRSYQGIEIDWVGVIIGPDLVVRNGKLRLKPQEREPLDPLLRTYRQLLRTGDEAEARRIGRSVVRGSYRIMLTRGLMGCYIYCTDPETREYFRDQLICPR